MTIQLFRTIIALGYSISMDKPPSRIRTVRLPNEPFLQTNGYKPAPLDLSAIELNVKMEELVDQLAENTHNVWAKERISQVKGRCNSVQTDVSKVGGEIGVVAGGYSKGRRKKLISGHGD